MPQTTVEQFAKELKLTPELLIEQLKSAGVAKSAPDDSLAEADKTRLHAFLQESHGHKDEKKKITLTRKQTSEIKKSDATGKARTIQVEVRKKRTFVKVEAGSDAPAEVVAEPQPPIINDEELAKRRDEDERMAALVAKQAEERAKTQAPKRRTKKAAEDAAATDAAAGLAGDAEAAAGTAAPMGAADAARDAKPAPADAKAAPGGKATLVVDPNRPRIGERVVLKKDAPPTEGTLHRPVIKDADGTVKSDKKPVKKPAKTGSTWADDANKRRGIKTRGDASGGREGWRGRRAKAHHEDPDAPTNFQSPSEPVIRDVLVPETIR